MAITDKLINIYKLSDDYYNNAGRNTKYEDYSDIKRPLKTDNSEFLLSSEKSYASYINPAFSPDLTKALIHAKELVNHAEKLIYDITNEANFLEIHQSNHSAMSSRSDKMLQHIQEIVCKKFEEINYSYETCSTTRNKHNKISEPIYVRFEKDKKLYLNKPLHVDTNKNNGEIMNSLNNCHLSSRVCTSRSVQTNFEELDKSINMISNIKKLHVQKAPAVIIRPALKTQTLKSIHISPEKSPILDAANVKYYNYLHNDQTKSKRSCVYESFQESKEISDLMMGVRKVDKGTETCNFVTKCVEKLTKKNDISNTKNCINNSDEHFEDEDQRMSNNSTQQVKRKLNFNESLMSNISLESIQVADIDNILKSNNQKLDNTFEKTSKICKALLLHVKGNTFKTFAINSSNDLPMTSDSVVRITSECGSVLKNDSLNTKVIENPVIYSNLNKCTENENTVNSFSFTGTSENEPVSIAPSIDYSLKGKNEQINPHDISDLQHTSHTAVNSDLIKNNQFSYISENDVACDKKIESAPNKSKIKKNCANNEKRDESTDQLTNVRTNRADHRTADAIIYRNSGESMNEHKVHEEVVEKKNTAITEHHNPFFYDVSVNNNFTLNKDDFNNMNDINELRIIENDENFNEEDLVDIDICEKEDKIIDNNRKFFIAKKDNDIEKITCSLNNQEMIFKYSEKVGRINESLAQMISNKLREEVKEINRIMEEDTFLSDLNKLKNTNERAIPFIRCSVVSSPVQMKNCRSDGEYSEGEIISSNGYRNFSGQITPNEVKGLTNSRKSLKTDISNKIDSIADTISNNSYLLSVGEILDNSIIT